MDKKIKISIIALIAVVILGIAGFLVIRSLDTGTIAVITIDGNEYKRINLSRVKEPYDIEIDNEYGRNTVHIENGSICVSDADCGDKICVMMGTISTGGIPIVCMPHHLIIQITGGDIDA